jgi:molybdopterin-guanine dinucleotide biosynthesis protein A
MRHAMPHSVMQRFSDIEAFILVGGKSSRMGRDKALLEISGKPLAARAAEMVKPLVANVMLIGEPRRQAELGLPVIADRWPGAGPLGAIATALLGTTKPWALILACDLPYLNANWIQSLCERALATEPGSIDALVPASENGLEPLSAIYRATAGAVLGRAVENGTRKVTNGLALLKIQAIPEAEWSRFSPDGKLFRNLNTWQDYLDARNELERQQ